MRPSISPDGKRVAVSMQGRSSENIWVLDSARDSWTQLTHGQELDKGPRWSPDGRYLAFNSMRPGSQQLHRVRADGGGEIEQLTDSKWWATPPGSFSPDGSPISYSRGSESNGYDMWMFSLDGEQPTEPWLATPVFEGVGAFSPDGRWIAYWSAEAGDTEVYVRPFSGPGGKTRISSEGGFLPRWSRDGRQLFYMGSETTLMAVDVKIGARFEAGRPRRVVEAPFDISHGFDVAPDGRFAVVRQPPMEPHRLVIAPNWAKEMAAKRADPSS